jgi:hypothetical protein
MVVLSPIANPDFLTDLGWRHKSAIDWIYPLTLYAIATMVVNSQSYQLSVSVSNITFDFRRQTSVALRNKGGNLMRCLAVPRLALAACSSQD